MTEQPLIERLRKRAEIRRNIPTRKSVREGKTDRLSDLLEEAADRIEELESINIRQWEFNDDFEEHLRLIPDAISYMTKTYGRVGLG